MVPYVCIYLVSVFIASVSQVLLKKAAMERHDGLLAEYLNFPVIFAYVLFFLTTLLTVYALKVVPLSLGPILESTSYLYVTVFGVTIFKERITPRKALALALIVIGIALYSAGV